MRSTPRRVALALALTALLVGAAAPPALAAPIVKNGSFETGDRSRWRLSDRGDGTWSVYDDPSDIDGPVIEPPHGEFAIATEQPGPGSHVLHQRVRLPDGERLRLKFLLSYDSAAPIETPNTLGHGGVANQQFRVDVLKPRANLRTLNPRAILATAFRTREGDPESLGLRTISKGLTRFGGRAVRLRFVEVDNQGNFHVVIDRVRIV
jgi:hypothetical protein